MIESDRVGGARNDDRHAGQGRASPPIGRSREGERPDGCGNDVPMETQERFPQGTWKSRTGREIPTFPQADHRVPERKRKREDEEQPRLCGEAQTRKLPMPNVASLRSRSVVPLITITWTR
jgi:hypothetical protein